VSVFVATNCPELQVEIDFTNNPTNATRVWTDVSRFVRQISWTTDGRDNELTRTTPGAMSALLDNRDGRFDSTWTGSPYYPNVKRKRFVRVSGVWAGTRYSRWTGLIDAWRQEWPGFGMDATAAISASSTMTTLNLMDLDGGSLFSETTGNRVIDVLASFGLPRSAINLGGTTVPAIGPFPPGSTAMAHLLAVEETENGRLFTDPDGVFTFQDRHQRLTDTTSTVSQATIGDLYGEIPYQAGELDLDDSDCFNIAAVTPAGGAEQTWFDQPSRDAHFDRRISVNSLSDQVSEALAAAQYLVGRYANTAARIPAVTLLVSAAPSYWPLVLSTAISYRYTWKRRAAANTISQDVFVERISEAPTPGVGWPVTFQLSPAVDTVGWVAGKVGYSEAGVTTRGVY
jgi:hypothetical protein